MHDAIAAVLASGGASTPVTRPIAYLCAVVRTTWVRRVSDRRSTNRVGRFPDVPLDLIGDHYLDDGRWRAPEYRIDLIEALSGIPPALWLDTIDKALSDSRTAKPLERLRRAKIEARVTSDYTNRCTECGRLIPDIIAFCSMRCRRVTRKKAATNAVKL